MSRITRPLVPTLLAAAVGIPILFAGTAHAATITVNTVAEVGEEPALPIASPPPELAERFSTKPTRRNHAVSPAPR